jgi:hypothetical protein
MQEMGQGHSPRILEFTRTLQCDKHAKKGHEYGGIEDESGHNLTCAAGMVKVKQSERNGRCIWFTGAVQSSVVHVFG